MTLRLLAPAGPVKGGSFATVRASLRLLPVGAALSTWDWDDGHRDEEPVDPAVRRHAGRSHRYAAAGVYRVSVGIGLARCDRYVVVSAPGQIAASGWVRDAHVGAVAFGFLITPRSDERSDDAIVARFLIVDEELTSTRLSWLFAVHPGALHFGGMATFRGSANAHPYRVDVTPSPSRSMRQQLSLSVYAPTAIPGRDSPMRRVTGPVRPGRVELGPLGTDADSRSTGQR